MTATTWSPPCSRARRGRSTHPTTCAPGACSATRTRSRSTPAASSPRDAVVAQLADKVAELCGHDEGSPEEPLSSFGLTSISVAELGAFIRMQFNHQVSALELMTTATCLSLAEAIMTGDQGGDTRGRRRRDRRRRAHGRRAAARPPRALRLRQHRRRPLPERRRRVPAGTRRSPAHSPLAGARAARSLAQPTKE